MSLRQATLAFPGELATPTGGYGYARRLIEAAPRAGWRIAPLSLPAGFPEPTGAEVEQALAALEATRGPVLADGLAFGALPAERLSPGLRARLVTLCHHPLGLETGLPAGRAARLLASEARALAAAAQVVATSHTTARALRDRLGVPAEKITVAPPGFDPAPPAPRRGDPPVILGVGAIIPRKGWDVLADALAELTSRPWRATIAGAADRAPETAARLRARLAGHGLKERVSLPGGVEAGALDALYAQADLFCLPSLHEGYGMVIGEAMRRGLPVVSTTAGAIPEAADGAARLVPPGDPKALAAALAGLLDSPLARDALAAASRRRAERLPGWDDVARIVGGVLERVA
ncbi:MAG: glycosyltransferase family 4 protein [Pseudomonadota bacterium]